MAVCLGVILPACGGGGGGGGGSPTAPGLPPPGPPPGPPPDTSPLTNNSLVGHVKGLFVPGSSFTGSTVKVVGAGEDTVRTDNSFRVEPVETGEYVLMVQGAGHLKRHVVVEMLPGGANEIPALDLAEDGTFDLAAFDEIYREDGETGTARMTKAPHFKIDQKDFDSLPGSAGSRLTSEIESALAGPLAQAIAPFLNKAKLTYKANIPTYDNPCKLNENEIHWYADRDLRDTEDQSLLGWAWWCWWPDLNVVRGGMIMLDDDAATGTILHELVHILGSADHLKTLPGLSIIGAPRSIAALSLMDEQHLRFLYRRPPGLMSPDDARGLRSGDLTQLAGGTGMDVRCNVYPDGTVRLEHSYSGGFVR